MQDDYDEEEPAVQTFADVLVVDDMAFNITALQAQLDMFGVSTEISVSGFHAIECIKRRLCNMEFGLCGQYKLILMDFSMPDMNGPTTTKAIRDEINRFYHQKGWTIQSEDSKQRQPFICCLTAYTQEQYKNEALSNGMDDFKTKPLPARDLFELLEQLNLVTP